MKATHFLLCIAILAATADFAIAQSNINPVNKHAWGENTGWTNWYDAGEGQDGVYVAETYLAGYIWGENVGWINVGDGSPADGVNYANTDGSDFGVNIDAGGGIHGFAWGENIGWINFDGGAMADPPEPARIECAEGESARFWGYVWGENIGWINLDDEYNFVSIVECDLNNDCLVNGNDIQFFMDVMLGYDTDPERYYKCDLNRDGVIDAEDVSLFIASLLGS